jgi:hypothetical protein
MVGTFIPTQRLLIAVSQLQNIQGDSRVYKTRLANLPDDNPSDYINTGDNTMSLQILPQSAKIGHFAGLLFFILKPPPENSTLVIHKTQQQWCSSRGSN